MTLSSSNSYAAGAPAGWAPASLPAGTLAGRYVPSDASTVTQTSAPLVGMMMDRSANGYNATSTVGSQPSLNFGALNGLPTMGFSGAQLLTSTLPANPVDRTFIALYKPTSVTTQTIFGSSGVRWIAISPRKQQRPRPRQ